VADPCCRFTLGSQGLVVALDFESW